MADRQPPGNRSQDNTSQPQYPKEPGFFSRHKILANLLLGTGLVAGLHEIYPKTPTSPVPAPLPPAPNVQPAQTADTNAAAATNTVATAKTPAPKLGIDNPIDEIHATAGVFNRHVLIDFANHMAHIIRDTGKIDADGGVTPTAQQLARLSEPSEVLKAFGVTAKTDDNYRFGVFSSADKVGMWQGYVRAGDGALVIDHIATLPIEHYPPMMDANRNSILSGVFERLGQTGCAETTPLPRGSEIIVPGAALRGAEDTMQTLPPDAARKVVEAATFTKTLSMATEKLPDGFAYADVGGQKIVTSNLSFADMAKALDGAKINKGGKGGAGGQSLA